MENIDLFGSRLKQLRTELKLSQRDFAKKIGITASALSTYENGTKNPSIGVAMRIASQFHVSLDWLCGGISPRPFVSDSSVPFDLPAILSGVVALIGSGYFSVKSIDRSSIINSDDEENENEDFLDKQLLTALIVNNEHLIDFFNSVNSLYNLLITGGLGSMSYDICVNELINNYSAYIQRTKRYEEKQKQKYLNELGDKLPF